MKTLIKSLIPRRLWTASAEKYRGYKLCRTFWSNDAPDLNEMLGFYGEFIAPDDLVFDIGANLGNRSKIFYLLGAEVVAVDPLDYCNRLLRCAFSGKSHFHMVQSALGGCEGVCELYCTDVSQVSTLSRDWITAVKASGRFADYSWDRIKKVKVTTLDALIKRFGMPRFVKIDVEGFEHQVISGLSSPVEMISLEFTQEYLQSTFSCIDRLDSLSTVSYRVSVGESFSFDYPIWETSEKIKEQLLALPAGSWGDLYCRHER